MLRLRPGKMVLVRGDEHLSSRNEGFVLTKIQPVLEALTVHLSTEGGESYFMFIGQRPDMQGSSYLVILLLLSGSLAGCTSSVTEPETTLGCTYPDALNFNEGCCYSSLR